LRTGRSIFTRIALGTLGSRRPGGSGRTSRTCCACRSCRTLSAGRTLSTLRAFSADKREVLPPGRRRSRCMACVGILQRVPRGAAVLDHIALGIRRSRRIVPTRVERCRSDRTHRTIRSLHALRTLWTCCSLGAGCAGYTLWSRRTCRSRWALRSRSASRTGVAFWTLHALRALRSCCTCWPLRTSGARRTGVALIALNSLLAFWAWWTLRAVDPLGTLGAGRTLRREHVDLEVIVADDINDKIRYGERGQEEIAQTLTSRCSMRG